MESTAADGEVKRKHGSIGELDESSSSLSKRIRKFEEESVQDENPESGVSTTGDDCADKESLSVLKRKHESSSSLDDDELAETSDSSKRTRTSEEGIVKDEDQELAESSSSSSNSTLQHQEDKKEDQEMDNITTEAECGFHVNFVNDDEKMMMMGSMTGSAARDESTQSSNQNEDWVEELTAGFINLSIIKRKW